MNDRFKIFQQLFWVRRNITTTHSLVATSFRLHLSTVTNHKPIAPCHRGQKTPMQSKFSVHSTLHPALQPRVFLSHHLTACLMLIDCDLWISQAAHSSFWRGILSRTVRACLLKDFQWWTLSHPLRSSSTLPTSLHHSRQASLSPGYIIKM